MYLVDVKLIRELSLTPPVLLVPEIDDRVGQDKSWSGMGQQKN